MSQDMGGLYKSGGISFILSGFLFLTKFLLDLWAGPPPSTGEEMLSWVAAGRLPLSLSNEFLFFGLVFLIPAVLALYQSLAGVDRFKVVMGCGMMALAIPLLAMVAIVQGRLMYPVYGIAPAPSTTELVAALYYGGSHAVLELLGFGTILLSLAMMRSSYGKNIAYLGLAAGVSDLIGAYPWLISPTVLLATQVVFSAWFVAVGVKLFRMR